ncbi:recombination protein RecT [Azospirillum agricola]|uniref:recombinase RecT n=1 Tax=Azospirillum agricola TaxID=1720247 RepID=UPI001AEB0356|nr:recombinase RecT [Azospirillum agricola]MBP2230774.1 recombination protein RecT [Azospirillum agricola]
MSNAVAQRDPVKELQAEFSKDAVKGQLAAVLPAHVTPERFTRIVMTAIAKNPDLVDADRRSLFNSCLECAADGLVPNGKEAALVIFNTKEKRNGKEVWLKKVQYMPMVRGIRKLAFNSGSIKVLDAFCVYANDEFHYELGFEPTVTHQPPKLGQDRGPIIGVYAVSVTKDGERSLEVMDRNAVEKVRSVSRSKDSGPWVQWWDEMARKTVLRRLAKRLPMSEELERTIHRDDALYEVEKRREATALPAPAPQTAAGQLAAFVTPTMLEHDADDEDDGQDETPHDPETGEVIEGSAPAGAQADEPATDWPATLAALREGAGKCADIAALTAFKTERAAIIKAMPDDVFADWSDFIDGRVAELKGGAK